MNGGDLFRLCDHSKKKLMFLSPKFYEISPHTVQYIHFLLKNGGLLGNWSENAFCMFASPIFDFLAGIVT